MDLDLTTEPLGTDGDGQPVYLRDLWPTPAGGRRDHPAVARRRRCSGSRYALGLRRRRALAGHRRRPAGTPSAGTPTPPMCCSRRSSTAWAPSPAPVTDIVGARVLAVLGDSVTTDHISPAGSIRPTSPAGRYLTEHGVERVGLQLLRRPAGQPRGHDARHLRQRPAPQPAGPGHRGRRHPAPPRRRADDHLRRGDALPAPRASRSSSWPARSTGRARRGTGRPRARPCSASGPSSPRASSGSTART